MRSIPLSALFITAIAFSAFAQPTVPRPPDDPSPAAAVAADLRLVKSFTAPNTVVLTVTNYGPQTAPAPIVVQDVLPAGVTYAGGGCSASGQNVTCTRNTPLSPGATYSETFTVNVATGTSTLNCATVSAKVKDPNDRNNRSCACITPAEPCRAIRIDVSTGANNGVALPVGASDTDWIVTQVPPGATGANVPAIVPQKPGPWLTPGAGAAWITARPASGTSPQIVAGDYMYEFPFHIPADLAGGRCTLSARYAVDNLVTLRIDNQPPIGSLQTYGSATFTGLHATTPSPVTFTATPGPHVLRALVHNGQPTQNSGNEAVTGFLLQGTLVCECAPLP